MGVARYTNNTSIVYFALGVCRMPKLYMHMYVKAEGYALDIL